MANTQIHEQQRMQTLEALQAFALSVTRQRTVTGVCWCVAKHAIAKMGLVDCVVFVLDHENQILDQRAAHGIKSEDGLDILNPMSIPLGRGIVGSCASLGSAIRVDDTNNDPRYIRDLEQGRSELAVPVMFRGKVLAVIDSEHPEEGFFTQEHERALQTIAAITASALSNLMSLDALDAANDKIDNLETTLEELSDRLDQAQGRTK